MNTSENDTIILVSPSGNSEVWRKADEQEMLAQGYRHYSEWREEQEAADRARYEAEAEQARIAHEAWLADPANRPELFRMLRQERDRRIAATDYLLASDYPITGARLDEVKTYRQALRDLPSRDGAPWDGGGEQTPWPELE